MPERVPSPAGWVALAALGIATVLVYAGVREHDFLLYDDPLYVTENVRVKAGFEPATVVWALVDTHAAHDWHPLTWMSHLADVELFGLDAGRHLLTNVALHVLATYLLAAALFLSSGRFWESLVVAALFALHPQHVESVASVSERKDVLSTVFWCLGMIGWAWYARRPGFARLALVFVVFVLGVMAKPFVVTLPAVLLLLDYWPLRRASFSPPAGPFDGEPFPRASFARLVVEKLPFFLVAGAVVLLTLRAADLGATFPEERLPLSVTAANAVRSYVVYLVRTVWPFGLAAFYPHPGAPSYAVLAACALFLWICTRVALRCAWTRPHLIVGWLWYLGTLLPVIQLVQQSRHGMADRNTYVPLIGIFVAVAWEVGDRVRRSGVRGRRVAAGTIAVLAFLSCVSWVQVGRWRDTETLFRHALAVTEGNDFAHASLGGALLAEGRADEAEVHLREALRLRPEEPNSLTNLGLVLASRGETREAMRLLRRTPGSSGPEV